MDISIIIVNYNVKEYLSECLKSIFDVLHDISFEVILVDNASRDGSVEFVQQEFPDIKVIVNSTNVGFAAANNQAIDKANGEFVLLLNPDTKLIDQSILKMMSFLKDHEQAGICGPVILNADQEIQNHGYYFPSLMRLFKANVLSCFDFPRLLEKPFEVDWIQGSCMLIKRELLMSLGCLDDKFFIYGEEKDLCLRIKKMGKKVYLLPNCKIIHYSNQSAINCESFAFKEYQKSQFYFFKKHYSRFFVSVAGILILFSFLRRFLVVFGKSFSYGK